MRWARSLPGKSVAKEKIRRHDALFVGLQRKDKS
jgi:hypothetical protein